MHVLLGLSSGVQLLQYPSADREEIPQSVIDYHLLITLKNPTLRGRNRLAKRTWSSRAHLRRKFFPDIYDSTRGSRLEFRDGCNSESRSTFSSSVRTLNDAHEPTWTAACLRTIRLYAQLLVNAMVRDFQDKLERADKLVNGLAGEFVRWQASIGTFESMIERLVGDSLIAAAFLSYAGTFDTVYRYPLIVLLNTISTLASLCYTR